MKNILTIILILISSVCISQTKVTLLFNKGMTTKDGFVKGGIQLNLPEKYEFYMYGEKKILGIERFDSISQYKEVEKELVEIYQEKLCVFMDKNGESCGDTEISYEINNSPMFNFCNIIYFYYNSYMRTNHIRNMWSSISDGEHIIFIVTQDDGIIFQKKIRLKNGILIH